MKVYLNRTQILVVTTVFLVLFAIVYHIWADWGLITIHANKMPLGKVIASMERQGHANIQTDLELDTPVTMNVVKVQLTDALETLSVVTNSRWRLLYFAAGDNATLKNGEKLWFSGERPDGWRTVSFPLGGMFSFTDSDEDDTPPDPRLDVWTPKNPGPAPVQDYFKEAAELTNAGFAFPGDWNPTVKSPPNAGEVSHVVPKLIRSAGGRGDPIFFLSEGGRGGGRGGYGDGAIMNGPDPELLAERTQNEINKLPDEERQEAQQNFDTERAFWQSLQNMSDEDRRAAIEAHLSDPAVQQAMQDRQDSRDGRMSHDQRMQHFANYVNRKMSITGKP
ncbi:MAG: hypothetical protein ABSE62_12260 [Chthoniobacteraceae bacterium]